MNRLGEFIDSALAKKRPLSRKRSMASLASETIETQTSSSQQPGDQKSAVYKHPFFEEQLKDCGSYMDRSTDGIMAESKTL